MEIFHTPHAMVTATVCKVHEGFPFGVPAWGTDRPEYGVCVEDSSVPPFHGLGAFNAGELHTRYPF